MPAKIAPDRLRQIVLFTELTQADSEALLGSFESLSHAAGDVIIRAGDFDPALYVVIDGEVEIALTIPGSQDAIVGRVPPNGMFGETSFFNPAPHSATVRCLQPSTLLRLSRKEFDRLLAGDSFAAYRLGAKASQILAARLQATDHWVSELLTQQQHAVTASWRRFREGLAGSFDIPHGFIHPY